MTVGDAPQIRMLSSRVNENEHIGDFSPTHSAPEHISDSPVLAKHREQKSREADFSHQHRPPDILVRFHFSASTMSVTAIFRQSSSNDVQ
jgi:hypothetical protein